MTLTDNKFHYNAPSEVKSVMRHIKKYWRYWLFILTPIVALPLPIAFRTIEANCAYMLLIMFVYWIFDVIHFATVSFIPIVAFPLLGILSSRAVCDSFINEANMVFLASMIAGVTLEATGFQKRIALLILLKIGTSPRLLLLGIMSATVLLSIWIMEAAACAIMIPIVDSIMRHLESIDSNCPKAELIEALAEFNPEDSLVFVNIEDPEELERLKTLRKTPFLSKIPLHQKTSKFEKCLILSVAYSANIGALGTLTATTTNLVLKELATIAYGKGVGITYATWMMIGMPTTIIGVIALWGLLQVISLGFKSNKQTAAEKESIRRLILKNYNDLGPLNYKEKSVLSYLLILVLLWFLRSPQFMPGWQDLLGSHLDISDSAPAFLVIVLMSAFPAVWPAAEEGNHLVEWDSIQSKISWDILLLQGSGFAIAAASDSSGLTKLLGTQFLVFSSLPAAASSYIISMITAFMSEIMANSSLAAMLIPVLADMAQKMRLNPLFLMLPMTMGASLAFTLPIATVPNAMVYKTNKLRMRDLIQTGIMANVITVSIMFLLVNSLGDVIFNLTTYPEWAMNQTIPLSTTY